VDGWIALEQLVDDLGGIDAVSAYLQLDPDVVSVALATPQDARSNRVALMVWENTRKLALMRSQDGFFWRLTRKRVVKDWLILAKMGLLHLPQLDRDPTGELSDEQKARPDLAAKVFEPEI
jgi:hypothetical protein